MTSVVGDGEEEDFYDEEDVDGGRNEDRGKPHWR